MSKFTVIQYRPIRYSIVYMTLALQPLIHHHSQLFKEVVDALVAKKDAGLGDRYAPPLSRSEAEPPYPKRAGIGPADAGWEPYSDQVHQVPSCATRKNLVHRWRSSTTSSGRTIICDPRPVPDLSACSIRSTNCRVSGIA